MISEHFTIATAVALYLLALVPLRADDESDQTAGVRDHTKLLHRLRDIVIDRIDLNNASPKEAMRFLAEASLKADPERRGISFVGHFSPEDSHTKITVSLKNISVRDALSQMFAYSVNNSVVFVSFEHGDSLRIQHFYLPNGLSLVGPNGAERLHLRDYDVKKQLVANGIFFAPGSSAIYQADKQTLTVVGSDEFVHQVDEFLNL